MSDTNERYTLALEDERDRLKVELRQLRQYLRYLRDDYAEFADEIDELIGTREGEEED